MSDADETIPLPEMAALKTTIKRGFDPGARLRNRGLRKATIILYLDEELGPKLGWAHDQMDALGNVTGRARVGVVGEIDTLENAKVKDAKMLKELKEKRDELVKELTSTGIEINLRAVPPIIEKDAHRKARNVLKITEKNIPADQKDDYDKAQAAYLMTLMFQSVKDNVSGEINAETTYQDAVDYIDYLPPGQWARLDMKMAEVQYTDAISRTIEQQEDFS